MTEGSSNLEDTLINLLSKNSWTHYCTPGCPDGCDRFGERVQDPDVLRLVSALRLVEQELEEILETMATLSEVEYGSRETDLQIAQKRGWAIDVAGDKIIDLQDNLEKILTYEKEQ